jgi:hypothetical protein
VAAGLRRAVNDAVDRCWAAMLDLTPEQKDAVIVRLVELLALEVLSREPTRAPDKRH